MKKAQISSETGSNVAIFVLLLGLFLAVYVLLLPPEDREALLYNSTSETENIPDEKETFILEQHPGVLKPAEDNKLIHKIDSINLYSKEEPKIKDIASLLYLEKSLLSQTKRNIAFDIDDLDNLEDVNIVLVANKDKGNLIMALNNVIIYDSKVSGLTTILLPKELLQEKNNLEFSVSSPGLNIFGKNAYSLSNIKLRENYQLTNTRESRDVVLGSQEIGNDAELTFFLYCNIPHQGSRLRVFLNNEEIKSEIISCTTVERIIDIESEKMEKGRNAITFQIDKGDYIFSEIKLKVKAESKGSINYKFALTEDEYDKILSDDRRAMLFLEFNDDERKKAVISMNGNEFSIDANDIDYERDVSRYVKKGNNFIRITPLDELNIDLLRITLK